METKTLTEEMKRTIRNTRRTDRNLTMKEDEQSQVGKDLEPEALREGAAGKEMASADLGMESAELEMRNIYAENLGGSVPGVELVGSLL